LDKKEEEREKEKMMKRASPFMLAFARGFKVASKRNELSRSLALDPHTTPLTHTSDTTYVQPKEKEKRNSCPDNNIPSLTHSLGSMQLPTNSLALSLSLRNDTKEKDEGNLHCMGMLLLGVSVCVQYWFCVVCMGVDIR
jgi:hypothetical protein